MVVLALVIQIPLFSPLGADAPSWVSRAVYLCTYALLVLFLWQNRRLRGLIPLGVGMTMNAVVITVNGGRIPLSAAAARAVGLVPTSYANTSLSAHRLAFLGDVFPLPHQLPLATVVSPGDVMIVIGAAIASMTYLSRCDDDARERFDVGRLGLPFRNTTFRRLAAARFVSNMGDWLTFAAVVGWIYHGTGSTTDVAAVMLVRLAPPILGGGIAAMIVDRLPRRGLLVGLEIVRGACVAGALVAVVQDSRAGVLVALACSGGLAAISNAAGAALVPTLLPADHLTAGNAVLALLKDVAMVIGAAGAGAALAGGQTAPALAIDIATFAVSALLLRGLCAVPAPRARARALDGLRYLRHQRLVLLLIASFSTATIATGLVNAMLPSLLAARGLGPGGYGFGMAALGGGAALGEAIVGLSALAPRADRWIALGLLTLAGLFTLLGLSTYGATAVLLLAGIGLVDGTTDVIYNTVLQRESDPQELGAVFGFSTSMMTTTMVLAFAFAPILERVLGPMAAVEVAAGVLALGGVVGLVALQSGRSAVEAVPSAA